jgi:hypothetical protein
MALTKVLTGGIADSAITTAKITDANITTAKVADDAVTSAKIPANAVTNSELNLGSNYAFTGTVSGAGKILQAIQATNDGDVALSNDVTTLSTAVALEITPIATSSKIFASCMCAGDCNGGHYRAMAWFLYRTISGGSATEIFNTNYHMYDGNEQKHNISVNPMQYLDSPNTTSAVTYTLRARHTTGSSVSGTYNGYINRYITSVITLMEIEG